MTNEQKEIQKLKNINKTLKKELRLTYESLIKTKEQADRLEGIALRLAIAINCSRCPINDKCEIAQEELYFGSFRRGTHSFNGLLRPHIEIPPLAARFQAL